MEDVDHRPYLEVSFTALIFAGKIVTLRGANNLLSTTTIAKIIKSTGSEGLSL